MHKDWTDRELDELDGLDAEGVDEAEIAKRLGREQDDVAAHLEIVRQRMGRVPASSPEE